jgi:hypothetical protein
MNEYQDTYAKLKLFNGEALGDEEAKKGGSRAIPLALV